MANIFEIPCPKCKCFSKFQVIKSLNDSFPNYMKLICEEEINKLCCPVCNNYFQLRTNFLFVNNKKLYALLYIPVELNREQIIRDFKNSMGNMLNENHYLCNPLVFDNWADLKNKILTFEKSIVTTNMTYRKTRQEKIDDIDEESRIMKALREGDGDMFGF